MHWGVDYPIRKGTPIVATASGIVQKVAPASDKSSYGIHVVLGHDETYSSLYGHLSKALVEEGSFVQKGDTIALSGNTGKSTAPHLHYEVIKHGISVNPMSLMKKISPKIAER